MKTSRLYIILGMLLLSGCNAAVQSWVGKSKPPKLPIPSIPVAGPSVTPVPGYTITAGGQQMASASYKLHVRIGKSEQLETASSASYKIRTGLTRMIKDQ